MSDSLKDSRQPKVLSARDRISKLTNLRKQKNELQLLNRKEIINDYENKKINLNHLNNLKLRQERLEDKKDDIKSKSKNELYNREKSWNWSIEQIEKWDNDHKSDEISDKKKEGFQNYDQLAEQTYKKELASNITDLSSNKEKYLKQKKLFTDFMLKNGVNEDNIDETSAEYTQLLDTFIVSYNETDKTKLKELIKQMKSNDERKSKIRNSRNDTNSDDSSIGYINEKNRQFNEKLNRHYDKYTKDLKDDIERGTAL
ncbi:hypothetical protein B5S30_g5336 [[Candida] boidinii]|nr:hypothetical protein B5S30_g5336 [[Candida] boidinii]GMG32968.1 unnamed protein product [[Candida] boidinii]